MKSGYTNAIYFLILLFFSARKLNNMIFFVFVLGHSLSLQKNAAAKALTISCVICKSQMPDPKTYKQHFENKHPKADLPEDLKEVADVAP